MVPDEADGMVRVSRSSSSFPHLRLPSFVSHFLHYVHVRVQVSKMEIEIQSTPLSLRSSYQSRTESAKANLAHYKKLSKDTHASLAHSELLSFSLTSPSCEDPYSFGTTSDRARLLTGTELLEEAAGQLA